MSVILRLNKESNGGWFFDVPLRKLEKENYGYYINLETDEGEFIKDSGNLPRMIGKTLKFAKDFAGGFTHPEYPKTLIFSNLENALIWFNYVKNSLVEMGYIVDEKIED